MSKTAKDYPLMQQFCSGAFSANSGGKMEDDAKLHISAEARVDADFDQWEYAENWLKNWLEMTMPDGADAWTSAFSLGMMADDGYTICWQDSDGEFSGKPSDELTKAPPYVLLDEYY
jgi:hypothetical protein